MILSSARVVAAAALFSWLTVTGAYAQDQSNPQTPPPDVAAQPSETIHVDVVVPPAPLIIRKAEGAISIPASAPKSNSTEAESGKNDRDAAAQTRPRYATRPVIASTPVRIGSQFGYRRDPFTRRSRFHSGVDIKAAHGDPVGASFPGTVQFAGWYYGYGNLVIVDHGGGVTTYYAHLSEFEIEVGERVQRGTVVGYAGRTGRATSPHLHYELRIDNSPVNPLQPVALDPSNPFFDDPSAEPGQESPEETPKATGDQR